MLINMTELVEKARSELQKARKRGYICPSCSNGSGQSGTGIEEYKKNVGHFKCQRCGWYGDTIQYFADLNGISNKEAINELKKKHGYITESYKENKKPIIYQGNKAKSTEKKKSTDEYHQDLLNNEEDSGT